MSDNDQERPDSRPESGTGAGFVFAVLLLIPVLYVLSIGPVAWLCENAGIPTEPVKTFYYPVIWLHDHTPLAGPLEWYVGLFGVH